MSPRLKKKIDAVMTALKSGQLTRVETLATDLTRDHPQSAFGWRVLAALMAQRNDQDRALRYIEKALHLEPDDAESLRNYALILNTCMRCDESEIACRRALALKPDYTDAQLELGESLRRQGRSDEARQVFTEAIALDPSQSGGHHRLGEFLMERDSLPDAVREFSRALELATAPGARSKARANLGLVLITGGFSAEGAACTRLALADDPTTQNPTLHSNVLFSHAYGTIDPAQQRTDIAHFAESVRNTARPFTYPRHPKFPDPLKIGLVSGDFVNHPVSYFLRGLMQSWQGHPVEWILYATQPLPERQSGLPVELGQWRRLYLHGDDEAARLIHQDHIHVLIDLSGHTAKNRLPVFARRPAPLQISWLGYWATTGLCEIDYVLVDEQGVPGNSTEFFVEKVWRLPETRLCFTPDPATPAVGPLPALHNGFLTLGSFAQLGKVSTRTLGLWAQVLERLPEARLRWQTRFLSNSCGFVLDRLRQNGIDPSRVDLLPAQNREDYLDAHHRIDFILDSFPYTGGTTTCEALWMGVPTLTLRGDTLLARQGASLLSTAGLPQWVCETERAFVERAIEWGGTTEGWQRLAQLRSTLRDQVAVTPVFDAPRFARHFEAALQGMWAEKMAR